MLSKRLKLRRIAAGKRPEIPSKSKKRRSTSLLNLSNYSRIRHLQLLRCRSLVARNLRKGSMAPSKSLASDCTNFCPEDEALEAASIAMSRWNEISISNKGREYEFVEVTGSKRMADPYIIHCNFIARPKNDSEIEPKLFFGELKHSSSFKKDGEAGAIACSVCCILGPIGTKTGLVHCFMCKMHPDLIQHPHDGDFTKGRKDALRKELRRIKSAKRDW